MKIMSSILSKQDIQKDTRLANVEQALLMVAADYCKDSKKMWSFLRYCAEHPNERFFQAVANWSGYPYIGSADSPSGENFHDLFFE